MALELRERLGGVGVERGQTVEEQTYALELREHLGGVGVERGQAVELQEALELRERLRSVGVERGQAVEGQEIALELRERLRGVDVERGQAVEGQVLASARELRQQCLGLFRRQAFDLVRVCGQLVCQCATRAEQRKQNEHGGDKNRQTGGGLHGRPRRSGGSKGDAARTCSARNGLTVRIPLLALPAWMNSLP